MRSRSAFTLIELLVVIAIIAILAVVVVLTLNPAELLRQSRDANRVSDMATLNSALNLYSTDQSGASSFNLGNSANIYISIPDTVSTCANIGFPSNNVCSSPTSSRNIDSTGWIPVNFKNISSGSPLSNLPVDPSNTSSSSLYYSYATNGSQYEVIAAMESQKYKQSVQGSIGQGFATQGSMAGAGPLGWWKLNEGSGSSTIDGSGNGNTGAWQGVAIGANGTYYAAGKPYFMWAGDFDGSTNFISATSVIPLLAGGGPVTVSAWIKSASSGAYSSIVNNYSSNLGWKLGLDGTNHARLDLGNGTAYAVVTNPMNVLDGNWHHVIAEYDGTYATLFVDNAPNKVNLGTGLDAAGNNKFAIGYDPSLGRNWTGLINDVRIYNRALSAAEVQELYNVEK